MDASRNAPHEPAARSARAVASADRRADERDDERTAERADGGTVARSVRALAVALLLLAATSSARAAGDEIVRSGKWNPKKPPPGWVVVETEHYQVQSQCGKQKAEALSAHLESMLELYRTFLPTRRKLDGFVLKLFKDGKAFKEYSGSEALAYYSQGAGELVGYDTGVVLGRRDVPAQIRLKPGAGAELSPERLARLSRLFEETTDAYTMDTARILSHEGWHQYFHFYTVSIVTMPSWLDEGVGDYFFMASRDEQNDHLGGYRLGDINDHRVRSLQRAFVDGTSVSFEELLAFEQSQYYTNPGAFYAQGWSMVQFLMHHEDPALRVLIPKLIKDFKDTKNREKSTAKVFKGIDMDELDRTWVGWVLAQKPADPLRALAREFGKELSPRDLEGEPRWLTVYEWYLKNPEAVAAGAAADAAYAEAAARAASDPAGGS
jgi:hypothetical protein